VTDNALQKRKKKVYGKLSSIGLCITGSKKGSFFRSLKLAAVNKNFTSLPFLQ